MLFSHWNLVVLLALGIQHISGSLFDWANKGWNLNQIWPKCQRWNDTICPVGTVNVKSSSLCYNMLTFHFLFVLHIPFYFCLSWTVWPFWRDSHSPHLLLEFTAFSQGKCLMFSPGFGATLICCICCIGAYSLHQQEHPASLYIRGHGHPSCLCSNLFFHSQVSSLNRSDTSLGKSHTEHAVPPSTFVLCFGVQYRTHLTFLCHLGLSTQQMFGESHIRWMQDFHMGWVS